MEHNKIQKIPNTKILDEPTIPIVYWLYRSGPNAGIMTIQKLSCLMPPNYDACKMK